MSFPMLVEVFFFFKQKTAYEMRISDWSSDVCSSDLQFLFERPVELGPQAFDRHFHHVGVAVEVDVPDHLGNGGFRQYFALAARQDAEQRELLGGQVQALA